MPDLAFPDGFLWGASTSAHQVEGGGARSDWLAWEESGRAPRSGYASGSWERWRDDLDIVVELGLNIYRISLEWSRLEPEPGCFDEAAFAHYAEVLAETKRRGVSTMVTLWHFTSPVWFAEQGGWDTSHAPVLFERYARAAAERLGPLVDHWATLNEAGTYVAQGYIRGEWPPGRKGAWREGWRVYRTLAKAHKRAYAAIKQVRGAGASVGLTHAFTWARPVRSAGILSAPGIAVWNYIANDVFLGSTADTLDWLGIQYYLAVPVHPWGVALGEGRGPRTDMDWRIEPRGLYEVVMRAWRRYRVPLMVTENGIADALDVQRARFVLDHLAWLLKSIKKGADVRGYLYWSLIDNYEWAFGFEPRFGLAEVDYETLERRIRPSARLYASIVRANALPEGLRPELLYADGQPSLGPRR